MAKQKISKKMMRHEAAESAEYERAEERAVNDKFTHGGEIAEHRGKYFKKGRHAIDHREGRM